MSPIWEFFKRAYEEVYDLPNFYLEIENELYCHIFSIFFILALFLALLFIIKNMVEMRRSGRKDKKRRIRMEKSILGVLEEKYKNKKSKNI